MCDEVPLGLGTKGFGAGANIYVADSANTNTKSSTNLGRSYTLPPGMSGAAYFTGSQYFQASEVEVYQVTIM